MLLNLVEKDTELGQYIVPYEEYHLSHMSSNSWIAIFYIHSYISHQYFDV